ncbi:unnamed protein product [Allacma fusca]|uniref:Uncharacterized protein n=1 Tax=Allacma fusca TaxID=39272 RepID=A0A8J2NUK9_9HEXA|nr:unnamed protein product [Allacma fusca]
MNPGRARREGKLTYFFLAVVVCYIGTGGFPLFKDSPASINITVLFRSISLDLCSLYYCAYGQPQDARRRDDERAADGDNCNIYPFLYPCLYIRG